MKFPDLNSVEPIQLVLFIIFVIFIVLPLDVPLFIANSVDSPLGIVVIFCVTLFLFLYVNPILGVLYILVAYELLRRSSIKKGRTPMLQYTPTEPNRDAELVAMNPPQYKTLEEEMVDIRAPIVGKKVQLSFLSSTFKPVADKTIAGASLI